MAKNAWLLCLAKNDRETTDLVARQAKSYFECIRYIRNGKRIVNERCAMAVPWLMRTEKRGSPNAKTLMDCVLETRKR